MPAGSPLAAAVPADAGPVSALRPDGRRVPVPVAAAVAAAVADDGDGPVARLADTRRPGFYTLSWTGGQTPGAVNFAATLDPAESSPDLTDAAGLDALADGLGATVADSAAAYLAADRVSRYGRELWRWLLAGLLGAMGLEMLLRQHFGSVR